MCQRCCQKKNRELVDVRDASKVLDPKCPLCRGSHWLQICIVDNEGTKECPMVIEDDEPSAAADEPAAAAADEPAAAADETPIKQRCETELCFIEKPIA